MYRTTKFEFQHSKSPAFPKLTRQSVILRQPSPARNNSTLGGYSGDNTQILIQNQQHSNANPGFSSMGSARTFESGLNVSSQIGSPVKNKVNNDFLPIGTLLSLGHEKMLAPVAESDVLLPHLSNHVLYSGLTNEQMLTIQSGIKLRAGLGSKMSSSGVLLASAAGQGEAAQSQQILGVNFMHESSSMVLDTNNSKEELSGVKAKTIATEILLKSNKNFKKRDGKVEKEEKKKLERSEGQRKEQGRPEVKEESAV